ncbi:MAG: hypothetical protein MJZ34_10400 [Paludibacteraceae bacterium]|nr:hypothetical protein [Paludibacteraceae bacterium]
MQTERIECTSDISKQMLASYESIYKWFYKNGLYSSIIIYAKLDKDLTYPIDKKKYRARDILFFGSCIKLFFKDRQAFKNNNINLQYIYGYMYTAFEYAIRNYKISLINQCKFESYAAMHWRHTSIQNAMLEKTWIPVQVKLGNYEQVEELDIHGVSLDKPVDDEKSGDGNRTIGECIGDMGSMEYSEEIETIELLNQFMKTLKTSEQLLFRKMMKNANEGIQNTKKTTENTAFNKIKVNIYNKFLIFREKQSQKDCGGFIPRYKNTYA